MVGFSLSIAKFQWRPWKFILMLTIETLDFSDAQAFLDFFFIDSDEARRLAVRQES